MPELATHLPTDVHGKASRLPCRRVDWCVRKSNYIYGMSNGNPNIFLDGLRNRNDRYGVHVLTNDSRRTCANPMTAHLRQNALFADPNYIATGILKALE